MIIKVMKINYYQASLGLNMIIKIMKNKDNHVSPRLDMIIKVMKNDYQASPELNMII